MDKVEKTGKFAKVKDLYGLYDLIAITKKEVMFVQVTSNRPHTHKKYLGFSEMFPNITHKQFVWIDRKGWKIFTYRKGKKIVRVSNGKKTNNKQD